MAEAVIPEISEQQQAPAQAVENPAPETQAPAAKEVKRQTIGFTFLQECYPNGAVCPSRRKRGSIAPPSLP